MTALHIACRYQALDTAILLIDHDCDLSAKDINSKTPLEYLKSADARNYLLECKACYDRWKQRRGLVLFHIGIHYFDRNMTLGNRDLLMLVTRFL